MERCPPAYRSPANASAATVVSLIRNIEQLKNKDKLISQLEKDLGHRWAAAQFPATLERTRGEEVVPDMGPPSGPPSHPPGVLPMGRQDPTEISRTPTSTLTTEGVEEERSAGDQGFDPGNNNFELPKNLKEKNKELLEKCRTYLQRVKDLTSQNRELRDCQEPILADNKKLQEQLEHSKLRQLQLSRQVTELHTQRRDVSTHIERLAEMKAEIEEDKKRIQSLTQQCHEKDRRIELIQHRKKRRRVLGSAEKTMGVRETYFGYDVMEEDSSSDTSSLTSSMSHSGHSQTSDTDIDIWGVLSREETERNYHRLALERLQLERSHAMLQGQVGALQDPQREARTRSQIEQDLFEAHCRIEQLEQLIQEIGEGEVISMLKEREAMILQAKDLYRKMERQTEENLELVKQLAAAEEKVEDLEFRLIEFEGFEEEQGTPSCPESELNQAAVEADLETRRQQILLSSDSSEEVSDSPARREGQPEAEDSSPPPTIDTMDQLRKELVVLLKGKGKEADNVLRKIDRLRNIEENAASMEDMAHEMQKKVVSLQQEVDHLQQQLKSKSGSSMSQSERQENLELKVKIKELLRSETELADERDALLEQVTDLKTQTVHLKRQLDIVTSTPVKVTEVNSSDSESSTQSPSQSPRSRKSKSRGEDDSTPETKRRKNDDTRALKSVRSFGDVRFCNEDFENVEPERMRRQIRKLETELRGSKDENLVLMSRLKQSVVEKSSAAEADQGIAVRLHELENQLDLLRRENETLAQRQRRKEEELDSGEISPRTAELEEFCEDLQERLHASENSERHLREKLKMVEGIIHDAEVSEMSVREANDRLMAGELKAKSQISELQKVVAELKDLLQDKDIQEQGLKIKVDFLQKAEAASVQRIEELESVLHDLREQLELAGSGDEAGRLQELRKQMTFLETDNQALSGRVAELEENEETLRENWRRVAEDDLSRTQCLEDKVKMLENLNRDLKAKLSDAQEYLVINTVPQSMTLASELAQSQTSLRSAAPYSGSDDSETEEDAESRQLREKVRKLERKLNDLAEQKNTKIESLQDKIVGFKENEIKLSETISEMEMTEREIRAKLALYESSEVTVEKMLKYQSKIQELRTSQESLLDKLEDLESAEMTQQEKMEEMERTLRGKIVALEVEMKNYKQKELTTARRLRELEKSEKELTEKVTLQAEKENGLYVKISTHLDEIKAAKEENKKLSDDLADKDEKVRKSKLLEVKLLEIEMEFGKKSSALSSKLRHKEEELRQREVAHEEEMKIVREEMSEKTSQLEGSVRDVTCERDELETRVNLLTEEMEELRESKQAFEKKIEDMTQEVELVKSVGMESEGNLTEVTEELKREKKKGETLDNKVKELEGDLDKQRQTISDLESQIVMLKDDISHKVQSSQNVVFEKEQEFEKERQTLESELEVKRNKVDELEKEVSELHEHIYIVEAECEKMKSEASSSETRVSERLRILEQSMSEKESKISNLKIAHEEAIQTSKDRCKRLEAELKLAQAISEEKEVEGNELIKNMENTILQKEEELRNLLSELSEITQQLDDKCLELEVAQEELSRNAREHEEELASERGERELLEKELRNKVMFLNSQLSQETEARQLQQSNLEQQGSREESLSQEIDQCKREIREKLSELESKNKENCQLSLELSQTNHSLKTLQLEYDAARCNWSKTETEVENMLQEKDQTIEKSKNDLKNLHIQFSELESNLCEKEISIEELRSKNSTFEQKLLEKEHIVEQKCQNEIVVQEQMQQAEILLQESGREKHDKESQLNKLHAEIAENANLLAERESKCEKLEAELCEIKEKLTYQTEELEEKVSLQKLKDKEIEVLKKRIQETDREISEKESENFENHTQLTSKVSHQQQDLAHAQEELQKCLQDIQQAQNECFIKDQQIKEKDQTYKELLEEKQELKLQLDDQRKELSLQLEEQKEETHTAQFKMATVQQELKDAENRYRELEAMVASLELQLEERFASAQSTEKIIVSKEAEMQEIQNKLVLTEKMYSEACLDMDKLKQEFKELELKQDLLENQYSESETSLQLKKEACKNLENNLEILESHCEILKTDSSDVQMKLVDYEKKLQIANSKVAEGEITIEKLNVTETKLIETSSENEVLMQRLSELEGELKEKENIEEKLKISEHSATLINQSSVEFKEESESLKIQVENIQYKNDELTRNLSLNQEELKESKLQLENTNEQLDDVQHQLEDTRRQLTALTEQHYRNQAELLATAAQMEGLEIGMREKVHHCEVLESNIEEACLEKEAALSEVKHLEGVMETLETENLGLREELDEASNEFENLRKGLEDSKSSIEGRLSEMVREKEELELKLKSFNENALQNNVIASDGRVSSKEIVIDEREKDNREDNDENNILKLRISELEKELKNTQNSIIETETLSRNQESDNINMGENELEKKYEELNKVYEVIQKDLTQEQMKCKVLMDRMNSLLADNESLTEECINLNHTIEELREKESKEEQNIVDESEITVAVASNVSTAHNMVVDSNDNDTTSANVEVQAMKIQDLLDEIHVFKEKDNASQQKLLSLESSLSELKDAESKLEIRVDELEHKEKDLLEHIADIEKTVIVPLEAENDDLKEELSSTKDELIVIKEERDEALAMLDTEEDGARDLQTLQRNLQESLTEKEELAENYTRLSESISMFEKEKDELYHKVAVLETEKAEVEEKLKQLENLESQTTVVEEAENRLMDRVLDLEEKEQHLTTDNEQLRKDNSLLTVSEAALQDKLTYLQQKNEVLQDAEEKYMDKIMELEEIQHRYQSQLALLETVSAETVSTPTEAVSTSLESIGGGESLSQVPNVNGAKSEPSKSNMSVDTSDLATSSEDSSMDSSEVSQHALHILESENERLMTDVDNKQSELDSLSKKYELLQDSEARLMEKLAEVQEKAETASSESPVEDFEHQKKIETLLEENEFLAENIENYKRFFKEEKQKVNDLNDRLLEESSQVQELQALVGEYEDQLQQELTQVDHLKEEVQQLTLQTVQLGERVETLSTEKSEWLHEREELVTKISNLEIEVRSVVAWKKARDVEEKEESRLQELQEKIEEIEELKEKLADMEQLQEKDLEIEQLKSRIVEIEEQHDRRGGDVEDLQKKLSEVSSHNERLQSSLDVQNQMEEDFRLRRQELQGAVDALTQRKDELRAQHREREQRLQAELEAASQREATALKSLESLEAELSEVRQSVVRQERRVGSVEEEHQSDSGLSVDADRGRHDSLDYSCTRRAAQQETSSSPVIFSSIATLTLTRPQSASPVNQCSSPVNNDPRQPAGPVAPPRLHRKSKSRGSSFDSTSDRDLSLLVDELRDREITLKKQIHHLETKSEDSDQAKRVAELVSVNESLKRRLKIAEKHFEPKRDGRLAGQSEVTLNWGLKEQEEEEDRSASPQLNQSFSSVTSNTSSSMLERPEDVLHQRIKELERLDLHNKNQMSELERDREVLHEITRKDKSSIHDLNVKVRELQLSERSLREQVSSLESSESSLFARCEEMEVSRSRLEDRVHELEVHERRLRELVRKLKLDEEHWLSKSGGMENAVAELSANEQQLKRLLQDVELERGGMAERTEYMEARVSELEALEISLLQRIKNYENNEVTLQNRLVHLENAEQAAQSKASELDVINMDVSQRLQRAIEENSVMSQHNTQLHGQVQDLDRRLMTSRDAELAYKQHVEALQKNESSLQKKVREYELREIDSQGRIRELEQTGEITQDKLATLQRSENKLKYRVQELEGIGGQIPGELTPGQRQKVPQKLEDCQKRVMVLQAQVENLQLQLRQALNVTQGDSTSQSNSGETVSVAKDDLKQLHTKALLLEETSSQLEEVERLNEGLNAVILSLRQGKGATGHEVEIEVLKRRLGSYKTLMQRLKSSLSTGQATSLVDPDLDSGPEGDSLPGPSLPGAASERVLQSVRGEAEPPVPAGGAGSLGLRDSHSPIQVSQATLSLVPPVGDADTGVLSSSREESHWRAIEARKTLGGESSRGGAKLAPGVTTTKSTSCGARRDSLEEEEVTLGLHLPSESESRLTYNDTDSSVSAPVPPPRRGRVTRATVNNSSENESNDGQLPTTSELSRTAAAANKKHFAQKEKSLPSQAGNATLGDNQWALKKQTTPLMSFGEESFYLPSSNTEVGDSSVSESEDAPPLPYSRPPGVVTSSPRGSTDDLSDGMTSDLQGKTESLDNSSSSGMSIRDRIAMIEKQLTDTGRSDDDEVFYWKKKSSEATRQAEELERENKHLHKDINKLEKELEEKRRYINLLELWLSNVETTFKNKEKHSDREMLEQVQLDLSQLRKQLARVGYRSEDAVLDPAALKTELERREREVMSKKSEVEVLSLELQRTRSECENIEGMRRTALDSLRGLERELVKLHHGEEESKEMEAKLKTLQKQYDEMESYKNQAVNMIQPLQTKLDKLSRKCKEKDALLRRLGAELRKVCHRPSSVLDDLTRLEHMMNGENNKLSSQHVSRSNSMDKMDLGHPLSDTDSIGGDVTSYPRPRPAPYVNNRPRSAEGPGHSQRGTHAHSRWGPRPQPQLTAGMTRGQFVAVADYDPAMFSQSGQPEVELALREGDHVVVTGSLDQSGYLEAVVSGRSGLVPATYLQPLNGHHVTPDTHTDHSPEQTVDLYRRLNQSQPSQPASSQPVRQPRKTSSQPASSNQPASSQPITSQPLPEPPHQLQVEVIASEKSILLSWLPPALDERGCSNKHKVLGYMVYLDGAEFEQVSGSDHCQVVLDEVTAGRAHRLSVQCLCGDGVASPRAELLFEGLVKLPESNPTDLSSVLNSLQYKRGHKRVVMALYDYSPEHQSPNDYTALELAFSAGDVLHVYGDPREDGFFHGEMGGKRGLVPACFVQDVTPEKLKRSS